MFVYDYIYESNGRGSEEGKWMTECGDRTMLFYRRDAEDAEEWPFAGKGFWERGSEVGSRWKDHAEIHGLQM